MPEEVEFATKIVLARRMLERTLTHHLPCAWVTADCIHGDDYHLRRFLTEHGIPRTCWRCIRKIRSGRDSLKALPLFELMSASHANISGAGIASQQDGDQKDHAGLTGPSTKWRRTLPMSGKPGSWRCAASAIPQRSFIIECVPQEDHPATDYGGSRSTLESRGSDRTGQRRVRTRSVRGQKLDRLVPTHHPLIGGPILCDAHDGASQCRVGKSLGTEPRSEQFATLQVPERIGRWLIPYTLPEVLRVIW